MIDRSLFFPRYKCKECQIDLFHDLSGIEAHMESHPKMTMESYSQKHETTSISSPPCMPGTKPMARGDAETKAKITALRGSLKTTTKLNDSENSLKEESKGKDTAPERLPAKALAQVKAEVSELEKKVKVRPSSPAKSIMSNSSSNPGMIKVKIRLCFELETFHIMFHNHVLPKNV